MSVYLEIEESSALDKLQSDAGISIAPSERVQAEAHVVEFLRELEKLPINQPEGGVRAIIHHKHISLKVVLWEIAAGSLALVPKVIDPTGISQVVGAAALGGSLIKLKDKVTALSDFQIFVCYAVVRVTRKKETSGKIFVEPGASPEEVRRELHEQSGRDYPNIADNLRNLSPKVLTEIFYEASGPFYKLIP